MATAMAPAKVAAPLFHFPALLAMGYKSKQARDALVAANGDLSKAADICAASCQGKGKAAEAAVQAFQAVAKVERTSVTAVPIPGEEPPARSKTQRPPKVSCSAKAAVPKPMQASVVPAMSEQSPLNSPASAAGPLEAKIYESQQVAEPALLGSPVAQPPAGVSNQRERLAVEPPASHPSGPPVATTEAIPTQALGQVVSLSAQHNARACEGDAKGLRLAKVGELAQIREQLHAATASEVSKLFSQLESWPMTVAELRQTRIGKAVRDVCKAHSGEFCLRGERLVQQWLTMYRAEMPVPAAPALRALSLQGLPGSTERLPERASSSSNTSSAGMPTGGSQGTDMPPQTGMSGDTSSGGAVVSRSISTSKVGKETSALFERLLRRKTQSEATAASSGVEERARPGDGDGVPLELSADEERPVARTQARCRWPPGLLKRARISSESSSTLVAKPSEGSSAERVLPSGMPPLAQPTYYDVIAGRWVHDASSGLEAGAAGGGCRRVRCSAIVQHAEKDHERCVRCQGVIRPGTVRVAYPAEERRGGLPVSGTLGSALLHLACCAEEPRPLCGLTEKSVLGLSALAAQERREARHALGLQSAVAVAPAVLGMRKTTCLQRLRSSPIHKALSGWRQLAAAKARLPPAGIISDKGLLQLARAAPRSPEELRAVSGLTSFKINLYQAGILEAIRRGRAMRDMSSTACQQLRAEEVRPSIVEVTQM